MEKKHVTLTGHGRFGNLVWLDVRDTWWLFQAKLKKTTRRSLTSNLFLLYRRRTTALGPTRRHTLSATRVCVYPWLLLKQTNVNIAVIIIVVQSWGKANLHKNLSTEELSLCAIHAHIIPHCLLAHHIHKRPYWLNKFNWLFDHIFGKR